MGEDDANLVTIKGMTINTCIVQFSLVDLCGQYGSQGKCNNCLAFISVTIRKRVKCNEQEITFLVSWHTCTFRHLLKTNHTAGKTIRSPLYYFYVCFSDFLIKSHRITVALIQLWDLVLPKPHPPAPSAKYYQDTGEDWIGLDSQQPHFGFEKERGHGTKTRGAWRRRRDRAAPSFTNSPCASLVSVSPCLLYQPACQSRRPESSINSCSKRWRERWSCEVKEGTERPNVGFQSETAPSPRIHHTHCQFVFLPHFHSFIHFTMNTPPPLHPPPLIFVCPLVFHTQRTDDSTNAKGSN